MATRAEKELAETDLTRKKGAGGMLRMVAAIESLFTVQPVLQYSSNSYTFFFLSLFITNTTDQNKYKSLRKSCVHCHSRLKVYSTEAIVHSSDGECISAVCSF